MVSLIDYVDSTSPPCLVDTFATLADAVAFYLTVAYEVEPAELLSGHAIIADNSGCPVAFIHYEAVWDHLLPLCVITLLSDGSRSTYRHVEAGDSYRVEPIDLFDLGDSYEVDPTDLDTV